MRKGKTINFIIYFLILVATFTVCMKLIKKGLSSKEQDVIYYNRNSEINYRVFLKENKFFDEKYLGMNEIYITSLIDYLDIDFDYNMILDSKRNGTYKYTIYALISADTTNSSGKYWNKKYVLGEQQVKTIDNQEVINIHENVKINYQKYNEILMNFKKEYNLSMNGTLKVYMQIEEIIDGKLKNESLKSSSSLVLSIPLTKATIEVPIEVVVPSSNGTIEGSVTLNKAEINKVYQIIGFVSIGLTTIITLYLMLILVKNGQRKSIYKKKIKKLLKTYDGIIVNVEKLPVLTKLNVIDVENFNELLDAHSEVRLPINFKYSEDVSTFILIDKEIAWRYKLKKER